MKRDFGKNTAKRKAGMNVPNPTAHLIADGEVLEPVIPEIETVDDVENIISNVPQFASLPINHLRILVEISHDILSETSRSDQQIAADVGCHRDTVHNARSNPRFAQCLGVLVIGIARGRSDNYLRWTETAAKDGKVGALKLLWELTGLYIKRTANLNMNVEQHMNQVPQTFEEAFDEFLVALGSAGYTADRITSRFNELRSKGAFG